MLMLCMERCVMHRHRMVVVPAFFGPKLWREAAWSNDIHLRDFLHTESSADT